MCEDALLRVKGVISFTFQMALKRCTVRIRADLPTEVRAASVHYIVLSVTRVLFIKTHKIMTNKQITICPESGYCYCFHKGAFSSAGGKK